MQNIRTFAITILRIIGIAHIAMYRFELKRLCSLIWYDLHLAGGEPPKPFKFAGGLLNGFNALLVFCRVKHIYTEIMNN